MTTAGNRRIVGLAAFGLFAVAAMLVCYALEERSSWFILVLAGSCALGSLYGFLQGAWHFGHSGGHLVRSCGPEMVGQAERMKPWYQISNQSPATLTAGDLRAWIATLDRDALRGHDHADLTLRLRYAPQAVQQVRGLMRQEQACCALPTFEMPEEPTAVTLTINAPEEARSTVDGLFLAFLPPRAG